ncbi:unnamed protein product [Toxocara canis]|uniref:Transmembrane protein n=1 Tax=Toxocara canis TaxID=6265 RepID=A0A183U0S3_TOXCA|nr:unnamed protein product [Toxocara canis]
MCPDLELLGASGNGAEGEASLILAVSYIFFFKFRLGRHVSGERSAVWTSLSQMAPADQAKFMNRLITYWPYNLERRALTWPLHAGVIANSITTSIIATRISSDMFLMRADTPFFEGVRQCPKSPLFLGIYSSGVVNLPGTYFRENKPCPSCIVSQSVFNALLSGIAVPMISLPYLSYYVVCFTPFKTASSYDAHYFFGIPPRYRFFKSQSSSLC